MIVLAWAFVALFALLFWGVPLGFGMGLVGAAGFAIIVGWAPTLHVIGQIAYDSVLNYNLSVVPLFVLMGQLFAHSRMADELYDASYAFVGHMAGGMAIATIFACGAFSAVSGSSLACAAAMTAVAAPNMKKFNYDDGFAAGTIAAGSTLDILIPPSIVMVIYAILTQVELGKLMIAGFLPGLVLIAFYIVAIVVVTKVWPNLGPPGRRSPWSVRLARLKEVWAMVVLFAISLGGIYLGVFTPTEAAGVGAFGAFAIAVARRRLTRQAFLTMLADATTTTSTIFFVVIGALIFANLVTVSGAGEAIQSWVRGLGLSQTELMFALLGIYILLGCVLDASAMTVLTVPIFYPIIMQAGIDPIWFGIFIIIVVGIGLIHPPMGMLLLIVKSLIPGISMKELLKGVAPYLVADAAAIGLMIAYPQIVLVLPNLMP
jgi:tripartite ATP-independent transporter DctM subunit